MKMTKKSSSQPSVPKGADAKATQKCSHYGVKGVPETGKGNYGTAGVGGGSGGNYGSKGV